VWLYLLYKLIDLLIRIPKRSSPSSVVNNILITGCDMGFGRETALRLDRKGFNVYAACLSEKGKTDLEKASGTGRINAFMMDVRDTKSIEKAYEHVKKTLPKGVGLWGLVNNAGIMQRRLGPAEWTSREDYQLCCDVNIFGLAEVTRIFLPLLKLTKGRIVNTASVAGRVGFPGSAAYVVSKYGVEGYSETLRPELIVYGIKVHIVEPGFHRTNLLNIEAMQKGTKESWDRLSPELKEEYPPDYQKNSTNGPRIDQQVCLGQAG
jgi:NAD(P)-dependent dehydrogenase (short-subunit alcohol dehydrogenase family)